MKDQIEQLIEDHGYAKIGRICGVSPQSVREWRARGRLPRTEWTGDTEYCKKIHAATGMLIKLSIAKT